MMVEWSGWSQCYADKRWDKMSFLSNGKSSEMDRPAKLDALVTMVKSLRTNTVFFIQLIECLLSHLYPSLFVGGSGHGKGFNPISN